MQDVKHQSENKNKDGLFKSKTFIMRLPIANMSLILFLRY